jgi:hypothetical protein
MLRRTLLSIAILGTLAAPAMADGLRTGGIPLVSNNSASNTNVAAGTGNVANQNVSQFQSGGSGFGFGFGKAPLVSNNTATNTNVAAGFGNFANQGVSQFQSGR